MKKLMYIIGFACLVASLPSCKKDSAAPIAKSTEAATVSGQHTTLNVDENNMSGKVTIKLLSSPGRSLEDPNSPPVSNQNKMLPPSKDYSNVNVDIRKVRIHSTVGGWMDLATNDGIYNLISLQNHTGALLVDKALTEGSHIDKIELILGRRNSVTMDGVTSRLIAPDPEYAPILINIDAVVEPRRTMEITIDFKAHESVSVRPKANDSGFDFFLEPAISVKSISYTQETINL